ncbi:hypothetical protein B5P41_24685 [Bacillus sp. SRB_28]|nr:hypothetical protein B5P41_24685 [Bacillus sp. SRB_28]
MKFLDQNLDQLLQVFLILLFDFNSTIFVMIINLRASLTRIFLIAILIFPEKVLKSGGIGKEVFENISKENVDQVEALKLLEQVQEQINGRKQSDARFSLNNKELKNREFFLVK